MKPTPNNYLKCPFFTSWYDYCGDGDELEPKDSGKCELFDDEQCSNSEHLCIERGLSNGEFRFWGNKIIVQVADCLISDEETKE